MKDELVLYDVQQRALEKVLEAENFSNRGVISLPTGVGKTRLAIAWILEKLKVDSDLKVCFFAHNVSLLEQAKCEFEEQGLVCSYYVAGEKHISQVTFASTQTMYKNLEDFSSSFFDYIVADEVHHYQARTFKEVLSYFSPKFMLGLTATPFRTDGKDIFEVCGDLIYDAELYDMFEKGILCPFVYEGARDNIDWSKARWNGDKYDEEDLNRILSIKEYDEAILGEYLFHKSEKLRKKTLAFCVTVEHAHRMADYFNSKGVSAVAFTRQNSFGVVMTNKVRAKIIEDFKQGLYEIIFTVNLFSEGMSVSGIDFIMMLRPTSSNIMFAQQVGRVLRNSVGKDFGLIVDYSGNSKRCSIVYNWLEGATRVDLVSELSSEKNKRVKGNLVVVSNGCKVLFDKEKIDLFQGDLAGRIKISKEFVIEDFEQKKKELGRTPKRKELYASGIYAHIFFGKYENFLIAMGEDSRDFFDSRKISDEELKDNYFALKKVLGRMPTSRDFAKNKGISKFGFNKYISRFGTMVELHKEYGDRITNRGKRYKNWASEDMFLKYFAFLIKKGEKPHSEDVESGKELGFGIGVIMRKFESYSNFKNEFFLWMEKKGLSLDVALSNSEKFVNYKYCAGCGEELKRNLFRKYCSNECMKKNRPMIIYKCAFCGKNIEKKNKSKMKQVYCSKKCKSKGEIVDETCVTCGKIFQKKKDCKIKYCCEDCSFVDVVCLCCGKLFKKSYRCKSNFCSDECSVSGNNVKVVSRYVPRYEILVENQENVLGVDEVREKSVIGVGRVYEKKSYVSSVEKDVIRTKIISRINDGDVVLLLESPELSALKEMQRQGKKPFKVLIPNSFEFEELAESLREFKSEFKIELLNTSVLQFIYDSKYQYDFVWLDYCGGFSAYKNDVSKLLMINKKEFKFYLTFCLFDLQKKDDADYIVQVSDFINNMKGSVGWEWDVEVSKRYKKNMYNLGFRIKKGVNKNIVNKVEFVKMRKMSDELGKEIYEEWLNASGKDKSTRSIAKKFNLFLGNGEPNAMAVHRVIKRNV